MKNPESENDSLIFKCIEPKTWDLVELKKFSGPSRHPKCAARAGSKCLLSVHECDTWSHIPGGPLSDVFLAKQTEESRWQRKHFSAESRLIH